MKAQLTRIEEEIVVEWHERVSGPLTLIGIVLLVLCLLGNIGVLFLGWQPNQVIGFLMLKAAPSVGTVSGAVGWIFTGYRWTRVWRGKRALDKKEEMTDASLNALGFAQGKIPTKRPPGFTPQIALGAAVSSAVVAVATIAPGPVGLLGTAQARALAHHASTSAPTITHTSTPAPTFGPPKALSGYSMPSSAGSGADGMSAGPDGSIWLMTNTSNGGKIVHISPSGKATSYTIPTTSAPNYGGGPGYVSSPGGLTEGPDHNLWFVETATTEHAGFVSGSPAIVRVTPLGKATQYQPSNSELLSAITAGPDGNLWFIENSGGGPSAGPNDGRIGRITPTGGISEYHLASGEVVTDITAGPDGNLWFGAYYEGAYVQSSTGPTPPPPANGRIGRITPSGKITLFPVLGATLFPTHLVKGRDGNLWFTETDSRTYITKIGRITPKGAMTQFSAKGITASSTPGSIVVGPDGNFWLTILPQVDLSTGLPRSGGSNAVARFTPKGVLTVYALPRGYSALGPLAVGPDKNIWFAEKSSGGATLIGRMYP